MLPAADGGPDVFDVSSTPLTTVSYDETDAESISRAVISAVSAVADARPVDLPPLYDVVDPEALDELFPYGDADVQPTEGSVRFSYAGFVVSVRASGEVSVYEPA